MLPTRNYSARDTAITQRPTSTALFTIDSEDRYENYTEARLALISPYDFSITLPASLLNGFFTRLAVSEIVFPWNVPNINKKTKQIIVRVQNLVVPGPPVDTEIELLTGFYTPAQLAAEIQRLVRFSVANMGAFVMEYGNYAGYAIDAPVFSYASVDLNYGVAFLPMTPLSTDWPYNDQSRQLFDVLGFSTENTIADALSAGLGRSGGPTFAQACRYVDIVSPQLTYNQALKDGSSQRTVRDALVRLYLLDPANIQSTTVPSSATFCPPGCAPTIVYRNFTQPKQIQWLPNQPIVGALRFQVYDDEGDLLEDFVNPSVPPSRMNWSMTLLVSEN
jgi:hypothetical protein